MSSGIYKITNMDNGKFYIGSAKNFDKRWYDHKRELTLNIHINPKLQHSWNSHGEDKFVFTILEVVEPYKIKLFEREQYYLDTLKPYERNIGYNICPVAEGGDNITYNPNRDAFIEKMKIVSHGENNGMFGKTHSDEAIQKQKNKAVGRYTLEWFVDRCGIREGKKKFNNRRSMLMNRDINHIYDNGQKGVPKGVTPQKTRDKISEVKSRMREIKPLVITDIKSGKYSMKNIADKYSIGMTAVKYYKKKIRDNKL
jgi:group I intron endonuclease